MQRVLIAECKQEVSSFNPAHSHYEDFRIVRGAAFANYHRTVREEISGALSVFDQDSRIEVVPTVGASANTSGGVLTKAGFERLSREILESIAAAGPVAAMYFCLHGAMQAENELDPEGYLLEQARKILGPQTPIVISLDLHGILTDKMLRNCDAVVTYHTYPHVDFFETGERAARLVQKILFAGAKPVMARVKIPALVRGDELITESGSISKCIRLCQSLEAGPGGLAAGVMWGNPFTDVPELRSNSIVVTDGDPATAQSQALELANIFWEHHELMQVPLTSLSDSIAQAKQVPTGTVVLMDAADATSSGASGDSNAILRELIQQDYQGRALIPIVDPAAVQAAFAAGVGAQVSVTVGGACDPQRYQPLPLEAKVRMLSDGEFRSESFGWLWNSGPTAVLESRNYTLIVGTRPVSLFDRSWFYAHGQDPRRFQLVVVKSPHCEHHMFAAWCEKKINVDAPGSTSANVRALGHTRCARPMFPLDEIQDYVPVADVFGQP